MSDTRKKEFLPFPFNTEKIELTDFREFKSLTIARIIQELNQIYSMEIGEIERENEFDKGFESSINLLKVLLNQWTSKSDYFILTIGDFENKSYKIHRLYHDMNYIHDYFYFLMGINSKRKEVLICKLGYE